jgi:hypothetical protein
MANMSYCRFQNTYNDLVDCYENMENVNSDSEKRYRTRLIELCQDIIQDYGDDYVFDDDEDDETEAQ